MPRQSTHLELRLPGGKLREALETICRAAKGAGGRALVVGGSVRDAMLGLSSKDVDLEVYGIEPGDLEVLLEREHFAIDLVGKSFGVLKIKGLPIDVALPRRESKSGLGHRSFEVLSDPGMSTREAQSRRDFTINAMYLDPLTGEVIDHFGGRADLEAGILRHTSERFTEDPLRVLRGMQFAARFDLEVAEETVDLCRTIEPEGLPAERLYEEWKKLVLRGVKPSRGLEFLRSSGWIAHYPELEVLVGLEQDPRWHPEGDVWVHTLQCMDAFAARRVGDSWEDLVVGFATLCHDLGKVSTAERREGRIISHGHEQAGEEPTRSFLARFTKQRDLVDEVVPLVVSHLAPIHLHKNRARDAAVRRLAIKVERIDRLLRVAFYDQLGRGPEVSESFPAGDWLREKAAGLHVARNAPEPIVLGRHLIELGEKPGRHFASILEACFEAQISGKVCTLEEGVALAAELLRQRREGGS